ncbi:hypothetical protein, partial [Endozoicomonas sp. SESOKO4]|uniref:hypothetical protein n=1 Tax=Endozoicomonas sp. SESOKO4 TaxID=2828745 RepID=UPI0021483EEA
MVRSLLLLVAIMFGESLQALEWIGSSPLPVHFLYPYQLAEPEPPDPVPAGFMKFAFSLLRRLPNNSPLQSLQLPPQAIWPMKPTLRTELLAMPPEVPDNTSNKLNTIAAAGGDDGDKPTDRNNWNPDPESRTDLDLNLVSDPIQKCLQQKKQLLQMLRIKRLWAITTGQTTLARILSNRIMVIEADLLDLERSNTANMHPVLVQTRLAENGRELSVYLEVTSDKYSGRQAANREKSQSSQTTKASTTETKSQTRKSHQVSQAAAHRKVIGSTVGNGRGGDDPMEPSAAQDTASSVVTCTKCGKALNLQELRRVAHEAAVSALLCKSCLSGTRGKKRARPPRQETEPDSSEPVQKKKKGPGRKRKNS